MSYFRQQQKQRQRRRRHLSWECLEERAVLAASLTASLVGTELRVEGTPRNDDITVSQSRGFYTIRGLSQKFAVSAVSSIVVLGLEGDDRLTAPNRLAANTNLTVTLDGGLGRDTLTGSPVRDLLIGGDGNDTLTGASGNDRLLGGAGTDRLLGGNDNDELDGGADADTLSGDLGDDLLIGGGGNDALAGGSGNDRYRFNADDSLGLDTLTETPGGIEVLDFSPTVSQGVRVDLGLATTQVINTNLSLILRSGSDYERVIGGLGNDTLIGSSGVNRLEGLGGQDTLVGLGGADELVGGAGNDTYLFDGDTSLGLDSVDDESGIDTLDYSATTTQAITINLSVFTPQAINSNSSLVFQSSQRIENVIGTPLNDLFTSGAGDNEFQGGAGNDVYRFDVDNPLGNDRIVDTDGGNDLLDFSATNSVDLTIDLSLLTAQVVASNLTLTLGLGTIIEDLAGGALNDTLLGNIANNSIGGGTGDDLLSGRGGNDLLVGGIGNDLYLFDADQALGADVINESAGGVDAVDFSPTETQAITINLNSAPAQVINSNLTLTLSSATAIENATGGSLDDLLQGSPVANELRGGPGADRFQGMTGNDLLIGGAGDDIYPFDADSFLGTVTINDESGVDTVDFSATTTLAIVFNLASVDDQVVNRNLKISMAGNQDLENIIGTPLNDILVGNARDNLLRGGAGNDVYSFTAVTPQGVDTIDDSAGTGDTLDYSSTNNRAVMVDLGQATAQTVNTNQILILSSSTAIENVAGGELGDTLIGNSLANVLVGGVGADVLMGLEGDDTLSGGDGGDRYVFNTDSALGADRVDDTTGTGDILDFSLTTSQSIVVNLGLTTAQIINSNLTLTLTSATAIEQAWGGALNDQLVGNSAANSLLGNGGDDQLQGLAGTDQLNGGLGNDIYIFNTSTALGTDSVIDAGGVDVLDFSSSTTLGVAVNLGSTSNQSVNSNLTLNLSASPSIENVNGTSLNDILTSNRLNNLLRGGLGDDTYRFDAGSAQGSDVVEELGAGKDSIDFSPTTNTGVTFSLSVDGLQVVNTNLAIDLGDVSNFENLVGGSLADTLTGNSKNNVLTGNNGDDVLVGLAGDDTLNGGSGSDRYTLGTDSDLGTDTILDSGTGTDTLDFSASTLLPITVDLSMSATQVVNASLRLVLGAGSQLENVVGTPLGDTITGSSGTNLLLGGAGNDLLSGLGGNDNLNGGEGDDTYLFISNTALGTETVVDSGGVDLLDFSSTTTLGVSVNLGLSTMQPVNSNLSLILSSGTVIENITGTGNNDTLVGNSADNVLRGGEGNDTYRFNAAIGNGIDRLVESGLGLDTIDFSLTTTLAIAFSLSQTGAQTVNSNLTIDLGSTASFENLTGGSQADTLTGNDLRNMLIGGAGDDLITGLGGNDQLAGGAGNDRYVFNTDTNLGSDSVDESVSGLDTLDFSSSSLLSIAVDLGSAAQQIINSNLTLTISSGSTLENVSGTALNDVVTGNASANVLNGFDGDDILNGLAGNDTVTGGEGNDTLAGGTGTDTLNGGNGDDVYLFDTDAALGSDTVSDSGGVDLLDFSSSTTLGVSLNLSSAVAQVVNTNLSLNLGATVAIENVSGTVLNDTFTSNRLGNVMRGGEGNDTYRFDAGTMQGSDRIEELGGVSDTIDFSPTTNAAVTFSLSLDGQQLVNTNLTIDLGIGGDFENLVGGSLADTLTGNSRSNRLSGGGGDDSLFGLGGDDQLVGGASSDLLNGGAGDDLYLFTTDTQLGTDTIADGDGQDWLDFSGSTTASVTVNLGQATLQTVNSQLKLVLGSAVAIEHVEGTALADTLQGNSLDNILLGGAGDDILLGDAGRDILVGGAGADELSSGAADDILIGGLLTYFDEATGVADRTSLQSLLAEWQRSDLDYGARIGNLRVESMTAGGSGSGGAAPAAGLNGTAVLDTNSCLNDAAVDSLLGGDELDWFWQFGDDLSSDLDGVMEQQN